MPRKKSFAMTLAERERLPKSDPLVETGPKKGDRLLSKRDVLGRVPASYPRIWQMMVAGSFPRSVRVGARAAWYESEIDLWLASRQRTTLKGDAEAAA